MKKIISLSILFILFFNTSSFATYFFMPTWPNSDTTEVNAEPADNFLNIESESAILIESTTRQNNLRKKFT